MNGKNRDPGNRKIIAMPGLKKGEEFNLKKKRIDDKNDKLAAAVNETPDTSEFDQPTKMVVKTAEQIESDTVIDLPVNLIRPMNGRIFCKELRAFEKKTRGGIIMATSFEQYRGEDKIKRDYKRYFVIDVSNDLTGTFQPLDPTQPPRKLRRGDEVFPFFPEQMTDWTPVYVIDWNNGGMKYCVFQEMELAGAGLINLIQEDDEKK